MLAQLPISAQSYSSSPYLDLSLFSYDDKWVSVMERPKACGEHPIRLHILNNCNKKIFEHQFFFKGFMQEIRDFYVLKFTQVQRVDLQHRRHGD